MSSAINHAKRSHRSQARHYRAAVRQRKGSLPKYRRAETARQFISRFFRRTPERPVETMMGEIYDG